MSVVVTVEEDISWILCLSHHNLGGEILWALFHWGTLPLTVQIEAWEWASVISNDDTVRIQHWDHFENEVISQVASTLILRNKIFECPVHHVRGLALSWMNSWRQNYSSPQSDLFGSAEEVCDDYHLAIIASQRLGQYCLSDFIFGLVVAKSLKKLTTVRVCVGVTVSQVDLVIVILEGYLEGECMIVTTAFALHCVLIVADIFSWSIPSNAARLRSIFSRVYQWFLTLVVRAVWFDEIDYVEFVADVFLYIAYFEVVPLGVVCCADIVFQYQIISVFAD